MPLTPQDVQNKVFSPTRFRTGYNEDEVDAFLDEVEAELTRLLDESTDLRRQLDETRRSGAGGGGGGPSPQLLDENAQLRRQLDEARRQAQLAQNRAGAQQDRPAPPPPPTAPTAVPTPPPAAPTAVPTSPPAAAVVAGGRGEVEAEIEQRVARTLVLAQRTADEAVREARADAERARREARADADRIIGEARAHVAEQLGTLEDDKRRLEGQVEQLRAFEREYRTRLRAYLEMQLRDLDGMPTQPAVGNSSPRSLAGGSTGPGAAAPGGPGGPSGPGGSGTGPAGPAGRGGPGAGTGGPGGGPATPAFPGAPLGAPAGAPAPAARSQSPRPPDTEPARRDTGLTDF